MPKIHNELHGKISNKSRIQLNKYHFHHLDNKAIKDKLHSPNNSNTSTTISMNGNMRILNIPYINKESYPRPNQFDKRKNSNNDQTYKINLKKYTF